jgi:hypothetical protein
MSQLRSDLWSAAFIRRHNDLGHLCVVMRKGDPIAGQIWISHDHLDGTQSLFGPAPSLVSSESVVDRIFQMRLDHAGGDDIRARIEREAKYDPDIWLIGLETRDNDPGLTVYHVDTGRTG